MQALRRILLVLAGILTLTAAQAPTFGSQYTGDVRWVPC